MHAGQALRYHHEHLIVPGKSLMENLQLILHSHLRRLIVVLPVVAALMAVAPWTLAQTPARERTAEIYDYQGPDRTARLSERGKQEGSVVLYTTMNLKDSGPLTEAFEKKYGVKVTLWRSSSEKVVQRAVAEARAGRHTFDVAETNSPELEQLVREKILAPFWSPALADLPPQALPKHRQFAPDRFNFFVIGYNTNLVPPDEVPNTYADLLHPRWMGRIGIEANDVDWFASIVKAMGETKGLEYFRRLAALRPQMRTGHSLIGELVASGEIPLAASIYNHDIQRLITKGAPVAWKALEPTFGRASGIAVSRNAPHPHAALLFADFVLSREGQEIIRAHERAPSNLTVESPLNKIRFQLIDPGILLDEGDKWEKLWATLFLKGQSAKKEGG